VELVPDQTLLIVSVVNLTDSNIMDLVLPIVQLHSMDLMLLLPAHHVELVVILVTLLVLLVLELLKTTVLLVLFHYISTKTDVSLIVQQVTTILILHNHNVESVALLVKHVMVLNVICVKIAQKVLTYIKECVLLTVMKQLLIFLVCSRMMLLTQKFVILVTLLVVVVLLMLTTVLAVLKVITSITTLVSIHVHQDITQMNPPNLVKFVIHLVPPVSMVLLLKLDYVHLVPLMMTVIMVNNVMLV
jgi:hypothetical protein